MRIITSYFSTDKTCKVSRKSIINLGTSYVDNIVFTNIGQMDRQVYSCIMMGTNDADMSKGKNGQTFVLLCSFCFYSQYFFLYLIL